MNYFFVRSQTDTLQYSGAYASSGVDNSVRLDNFCDNFRVQVNRISLKEKGKGKEKEKDEMESMEFDMIGIDPAIANAFRRILISEVELYIIKLLIVF